jgi:cytoskeletal protein RodZ
MPDIPIGPGPASANDRLQALRQNSSSLSSAVTPRKIRIELLLGAVGVLLVIVLLFVVVGSPTPEMNTIASVPTEQSESENQIEAGDALIAISLEEGAFPPDVSVGDQVRIIVTSNTDGADSARGLTADTVVYSVNEASAVGGRYVVTVSGTESVAEEVAASGPVHLAIVKRVEG